MPSVDDVEVGKYENQIDDLSIQLPSTFHDQDPIEENSKWFSNCMEHGVKVNPMVLQDHINAHKHNLESNPIKNMVSSRDTLKPLPSISHDSLFHDTLYPPTSTLNDIQPIVSCGNQEQGSCISRIEEQSVGDMSYLFSLFQDDNISFLVDH